MNNKDFEISLNNQIDKCKNLLIIKGKEYAQERNDRLKVFKKAAAMQGITSIEALAGMMCKHTCSIYDMCKEDEKYTIAKWEEKITDHINYLLLLRALLDEKININIEKKK